MTDERRPIPLEELLAHAAWVKGLARSLLFDQDQVDDVVQQTWMVAMGRRPREASQLRAWLGGIVRNVARNELRGTRRRSRREERAAVREELPPTVDVVARAELQRSVVDAVMALDEPYRSTVLMRWFDGLSAAQIARQLGVPDATVRARCRRALDRLREILDSEAGGERRGWSLALLPLALPRGLPDMLAAGSLTTASATAAPSTGPLTGALLMSLETKLSLGVVVLFLAVGGLWWALDDEPMPTPGAVVGPMVVPSAELDTPSDMPDPLVEALTLAEPPVTPSALVVPAGDGVAAGSTPDLALPFTIVGHVVTHDGRPIVGARVAHRPRWEIVEQQTLSMRMAHESPNRPALIWVETDALGAFEIEAVPLPMTPDEVRVGPDTLFVRDQHSELMGRIVDLPEGVGRHDVGDLVMQPAAVVTGRVVDESGTPLEGVLLASPVSNLFGPFERWEELVAVQPYWSVKTGADGRFTLGSLWPIRQGFNVTLDGFNGKWLGLEPLAGREDDLGDVVLLRDHFLKGVVVDAEGRGLAGADVVGRPSSWLKKIDSFKGEDSAMLQVATSSPRSGEARAVTDATGAFRLDGLIDTAYAVAAGGAGREPLSVIDVPVDTADLVLELREQATAFVRVLDERGSDLTGATGQAWRVSGSESGRRGYPLLVMKGDEAARAVEDSGRGSGPDAEGFLVIRGLGRLGTWLELTAPGHAPRTVTLQGVDAPGVLDTEVRLVRGAQLSGQVTDGAGSPVQGALVTAQFQPDESGEASGRGRPFGTFDIMNLRSTKTADSGAYRFDTLQAGTWTISVSAAGSGAAAPREVQLAAAEVDETQDFVLAGSGRLSGVVLQADGTPWRGRVRLKGEALGQRPSRSRGYEGRMDVSNRPPPGTDHVQSGDGGAFVFEDLPAGDFVLSAFLADPMTVTLRAGEERVVELKLRQPMLITGRVTDDRGPVVGANVLVLSGRGTKLMRTNYALMEIRTNADGWYRASPTQTGDYTLLVKHDKAFTEPLELSVDRNTNARVNFHFGNLRLAGIVLDAVSGRPLAGATLEVSNRRLAQLYALKSGPVPLYTTRITTDEAGRFALDRLSPGMHGLTVSADGFTMLVAEDVEVGAGMHAAPLEIRLVR